MKAFRAFAKTNCDKGYVHGYDRYYDEIFEDYIPNSLLEIGISSGNSLAAWRLMFPKCDIWGIDITAKYFFKKNINFANANIVIADSTKLETVQKLKSNYDVIIDDGSHYYKDTMRNFKNFHNKFNNYYIIEDYYYDVDLAKKFINNFGYDNITFYKSSRAILKLPNNRLYKSRKKTFSVIRQNMIIIKR